MKAIQNHVARLRASFASLDRDLIETTPGGYRLAVDPGAIDAVAFERRATEGRRRLAAGDTAAAVVELTDALALWRGPAYADVADAEFALGEAARLNELRWAATEDLAEAQVAQGSFELASADLSRLVQDQPGRERAWGLFIRALYAAGRQRDALAAYQQARQVLVDEFGLEPGPELRALERRVLEQDPELSVRRASAVPAALRRDTNALVDRDRWSGSPGALARTRPGCPNRPACSGCRCTSSYQPSGSTSRTPGCGSPTRQGCSRTSTPTSPALRSEL